MDFQASAYGHEVARILATGENGARAMPLAPSRCASPTAREELNGWQARDLFPSARCPEGAMCGLYLYYSCLDEAHRIAQELETPDGSYWHAIMHRQEPDAFNSGYWFDRVGKHPVFPALNAAALALGYPASGEWEPRRFIDFCESARQRPGSADESLALRVQLAEWQLLFDYCAGPARAPAPMSAPMEKKR